MNISLETVQAEFNRMRAEIDALKAERAALRDGLIEAIFDGDEVDTSDAAIIEAAKRLYRRVDELLREREQLADKLRDLTERYHALAQQGE